MRKIEDSYLPDVWSTGRLQFDFTGKKKAAPFELYAQLLPNCNLRFEADGNEWIHESNWDSLETKLDL